MSSSSMTLSVASPATMASWPIEKVEEWTTALSIELKTAEDTSVVLKTAPTGTYPPDSALDNVMMSGRTSQCSWQKNRPLRPIPVWTSSITSNVPWRRHTDCTSAQ